MTDYYLRSSGGSDADDGLTWANAKATMAGVLAIPIAAGDRVFVRNDHSETTGAQTWVFPGTPAAPNQVICVSDAAEPPTARSTGALFATTTSTARTIRGTVKVYGLTLGAGAGGSSASMTLGASSSPQIQFQEYEECTLRLQGTGTTGRLIFGTTGTVSSSRLVLINPTFSFTNASQGCLIQQVELEIFGGATSNTTPTSLILFAGATGSSNACRVTFNGFEFSGYGTAFNLTAQVTGATAVTFRGCKFAASWAGAIVLTSIDPGARVRIIHSMAGTARLRYNEVQYPGTIEYESTIVRSGGAVDDGADGGAMSYKCTTNANCSWPHAVLILPEVFHGNTTTGSAVVPKIGVVHDSVTNLTTRQFYASYLYKATASSDLLSLASDRCEELVAASDLAASSETWTTTGMTNPNKQQLAKSITPQVAGDIIIQPYMGVASKVVYYCPRPFA